MLMQLQITLLIVSISVSRTTSTVANHVLSDMDHHEPKAVLVELLREQLRICAFHTPTSELMCAPCFQRVSSVWKEHHGVQAFTRRKQLQLDTVGQLWCEGVAPAGETEKIAEELAPKLRPLLLALKLNVAKMEDPDHEVIPPDMSFAGWVLPKTKNFGYDEWAAIGVQV